MCNEVEIFPQGFAWLLKWAKNMKEDTRFLFNKQSHMFDQNTQLDFDLQLKGVKFFGLKICHRDFENLAQ